MGQSVLIADDDESTRELTALVLEQAGYRVRTAADGAEALAELARAPADAMLLDMMMPEVDGVQLLDRLPREVAPPLPLVVAHSGFERLEELALSHGAAAFLKKPVEPRHLLEVLARLLAERALSIDGATARAQAHHEACAAADERRERIVHRARLESPALRAQLRSLVAWLTGYFGTEVAVVALVHCGRIFVLALDGTDDPAEDACLELDRSYCPDVARAATPLIVAATGAGAPFAAHPAAASSLPYYAGAPLLAEGTSLGTLCLRDARPFVVHAEDLALLGHFAELVGRHLADRDAAALDLFRADGLLAPAHLDIVVERALFRAERDASAVALAVVEADGVEAAAGSVAARAGRRHVAVVSLAPGQAVVVVEGASPPAARARLAAGLGAVDGAQVRAAVAVADGRQRRVDPAGLVRALLALPRVAVGLAVAAPPPG